MYNPRTLYIAFGFISLLHVIFILGGWSQEAAVSKVFLIPTLMLAVYATYNQDNRGGSWIFNLLLALCLSWIGDVLLIFEGFIFFILGLVAFLSAHICYLRLILKPKPMGYINHNLRFSLVIAAVIMLPLKLILQHLPGDLLIPVILYALVLLSLFFASNFRSKAVVFYRDRVIWGALLFAASDTLLAYNRFVTPLVWAPGMIMITYLSAQFFLSKGLLSDYEN